MECVKNTEKLINCGVNYKSCHGKFGTERCNYEWGKETWSCLEVRFLTFTHPSIQSASPIDCLLNIFWCDFLKFKFS